MTVTWIEYDKEELFDRCIRTTGGWVDGHKWDEYISSWPDEAKPYLEAIRADVLAKGLRLTGEQHQYSDCGMPKFPDNTVAAFSFRAWGDLMAAIWNTEEGVSKYSYIDFYC